MPYTQEVMENPEWSVTLRDETPRELLDQIALTDHAFSTIVIVPYEMVPEDHSDAEIVGGALDTNGTPGVEFMGRLMEQSRDLKTLSGDGIIGWLGEENDGGNMYAGADGTSASLGLSGQLDARVFTSFANGLTSNDTGDLTTTARTIKTPGNTTRRQFLDTILSLYPGGPYEWFAGAGLNSASNLVPIGFLTGQVLYGRRGGLFESFDQPTVILAREGGSGATTGSRKYLSVDGSGDYAATPDTSALDITGDIDLRIRVRAADYSTGSNEWLIGKWNSGANQRSYALRLDTTGELVLTWSTNGTATISEIATGTSLTDGNDYWLRATLDVNDGGGNRVTRFYKSSDTTNAHEDVSWTLFDTNTTAGTTSIHSGTGELGVASVASTGDSAFTGRVYAAAVLSGITDGTVVADPVFAEWPSGDTSEPDDSGLTWTCAGNAFIAGTESTTVTGLPCVFSDESGRDVWDYRTVVEVRWNDGTDNGSATNTPPSGWVDFAGATPVIRSVIDQSPRVPFKDRPNRWSARVGGNRFAAWALNSQTMATRTAVASANAVDSFAISVTAEVDTPDISRYMVVGDTVYVWDQSSDLVDTTNEVEYRGEPAHPIKLRVQRMEVPITDGKGVFLRVWDGAAFDYINLTRWVDWDEAPAVLELGTKRWNTRGFARPKRINKRSFLRRYRQHYKLGRLTFGG